MSEIINVNTTIFTVVNIIVYNMIGLPLIIKIIKGRQLTFSKVSMHKELILWLLLLFFCVYATYSGDWIHYKEIIAYVAINSDAVGELEPFYMNLIQNIGDNYLVFRLIIWGGSLLLLRMIFGHLSINSEVAIRLFSIWAIVFFAYPRVSIGVSLFFFGYLLIVKPYRRFWLFSIGLGLFCVYQSLNLHKSVIILLCLIPISFVNINKWKSFILPIIFYISIIYLNKYLFIFESNAGFHYVHEEAEIVSLGYALVSLLMRLPIYIIVVGMLYKFSVKERYKNIPYSIKRTYFFMLSIFITSMLFLFADIESRVIFYRILYMIYIPLVILIIFCLRYGISKELMKKTTLFAYFVSNLFLCYSLLGHINGTIQ